MENNVPHRTFLVTYSQLDYRKFPTRLSFGGAVLAAFSANNVNYFVAAKENHETSSTGYHHHVAVCIIKPMRWKTAKSYIFENYGATVNFAASSDMDVGAYRMFHIEHIWLHTVNLTIENFLLIGHLGVP